MNMEIKSEIIKKRKKKIVDLMDKNINLFPNDFIVSHTVQDIKQAIIDAPDSFTENYPVFVVAVRFLPAHGYSWHHHCSH